MILPAAPGPAGAPTAEQRLDDIETQILRAKERLDIAQHRLAEVADPQVRHESALLQEVNEQLVTHGLRAQQMAETSAQALTEMARVAQLDALTSLPNRAVLRARLGLAMLGARQADSGAALLLLDLGGFTQVNDTLGHAMGDQMLRVVADRLVAAVHHADTVSLHGRHQFLILLADVPGPAQALEVAGTLVAALGTPFVLGDHVLRLAAHVGISLYPEDGHDIDGLIDRAVAALYRATLRELDAFAFSAEPPTAERSLELRTLESLRNPLARHDVALAEHLRQHNILQEANTQLVLSALSARDRLEIAERARRRQTELMGMVAHELRHPLGPLRHAAGILARVPAASPLLTSVQAVIERQVVHMARLVSDLLDVSRAATGKLTIERRPLDLIALIDEGVEACRPAMDARLQHLSVQLPRDAAMVHGDAVRLMQVLHNLLDNASKYTPEGGSIWLGARATGEQVVLTVSDSGIGISAEALPNIFEPFMQDAHARSFNRTGLGIGLAVVRELVEAHGGQIRVVSPGVGRGCEFTLTLPLMSSPAVIPA